MKSQLIENEDLYTCVWWTGKHEVRHEAWFYYDYNTKQWFYGANVCEFYRLNFRRLRPINLRNRSIR